MLACASGLLVNAASVGAQGVQAHRVRPKVRADTSKAPARKPAVIPVIPPIPTLPGALLPESRIIAYYGNPLSTQMGILGALPKEQMLDKLAATAEQWAKADTSHVVRPALQLIATVALGNKGADGKYRVRHSDSLIAKVAS